MDHMSLEEVNPAGIAGVQERYPAAKEAGLELLQAYKSYQVVW